jgi:hypothetical protein
MTGEDGVAGWGLANGVMVAPGWVAAGGVVPAGSSGSVSRLS